MGIRYLDQRKTVASDNGTAYQRIKARLKRRRRLIANE